MKKIFFTIALLTIFSLSLISCKPSKKEQAEIDKLEQETKAIDSLSTVIEKSKQDIEDTTKEVDNLLEEL